MHTHSKKTPFDSCVERVYSCLMPTNRSVLRIRDDALRLKGGIQMNFDLTQEQLMIKNMVRDFADAEIRPNAEHVDRTGEFPYNTFMKMGELGMLGLPISEEYGGAGADT